MEPNHMFSCLHTENLVKTVYIPTYDDRPDEINGFPSHPHGISFVYNVQNATHEMTMRRTVRNRVKSVFLLSHQLDNSTHSDTVDTLTVYIQWVKYNAVVGRTGCCRRCYRCRLYSYTHRSLSTIVCVCVCLSVLCYSCGTENRDISYMDGAIHMFYSKRGAAG